MRRVRARVFFGRRPEDERDERPLRDGRLQMAAESELRRSLRSFSEEARAQKVKVWRLWSVLFLIVAECYPWWG